MISVHFLRVTIRKAIFETRIFMRVKIFSTEKSNCAFQSIFFLLSGRRIIFPSGYTRCRKGQKKTLIAVHMATCVHDKEKKDSMWSISRFSSATRVIGSVLNVVMIISPAWTSFKSSQDVVENEKQVLFLRQDAHCISTTHGILQTHKVLKFSSQWVL